MLTFLNEALEADAEEFIDIETAKQAGRTGFNKMLAFLRATPVCRTILVEKTDRLYRNIRDWVTVDDLDVTVHFVKEGAVVSKTSRSSRQIYTRHPGLDGQAICRQFERGG